MTSKTATKTATKETGNNANTTSIPYVKVKPLDHDKASDLAKGIDLLAGSKAKRLARDKADKDKADKDKADKDKGNIQQTRTDNKLSWVDKQGVITVYDPAVCTPQHFKQSIGSGSGIDIDKAIADKDKADKDKAIQAGLDKAAAIQANVKIVVQKDLFDWLAMVLDIDAKINPNKYAMYDYAKNGTSIKAFIVNLGAAKKIIKVPTLELKGGLFCGNILTPFLPDIYKNDHTTCVKPLFVKHSKGNYKIPARAGDLMTKSDLVAIRKSLLSAIDTKSLPASFNIDCINK